VDLVASQEVSFEGIVTHRFPIEEASEAYRIFDEGETGKVVFEWDT